MSIGSHWQEVFGEAEQPAQQEPWQLPGWLMDWEQWVTFAVMLPVVLSAALSVQAAGWVPGMPSLAVPSVVGLVMAMFLARVRTRELLLHPLGLAAGLGVVMVQVLRFLGSGNVWDRLREFWDRMTTWVEVVRSGGISTDNLPFVVIVVALAWLAAYLGGWAAFRWRSGWLAVVPSGVALLVNLSYQPGRFSPAFVVFALGALLLITRTHVTDAIRRWRQQGVEYPELLSLTALSGTGWVVVGLLVLVLVLPTAGPMTGLASLWEKVRSPVEGWTVDWGIFTTVDAKKPVPIHRFDDAMPLQGAIKLNNREVALVTADSAPYPIFLRAAVYETYTGAGWKAGDREQVPLDEAAAEFQAAGYQRRQEVNATVDPARGNEVLLGPGLPVRLEGTARAEVVEGGPPSEIARLLRGGSGAYTVTGSISVATADELRRAGTAYPGWVREQYLQVPPDLPDRVRELARDWAGRRDNPYDTARAIEDQLRTYPVEYEIPVAPPGADAVDHFLFEERKGYFDYHASAMAVLLRTLGIPARMVVGYQLNELDPSGGFYTVRERDAFAWVEVYFPGYGWVEFNPTTGSPSINREVSPDVPAAELPADPGLPPEEFPLEQFPMVGDPAYQGSQPDSGRPWGWYILGSFAAVVLAGGAGAWLVWQRLTAGLPYPVQVWEKAVRLAGWARVPHRPHETPAETARRIGSAVPGGREAEALAAAYTRHRYGRKLLSAAERRDLARAWSRLRNLLVARIVRWR